jgi:non-lysosomal glucosylceramidase
MLILSRIAIACAFGFFTKAEVNAATPNPGSISPYAWSLAMGGGTHKAGIPLGGIGAGNFMYNTSGSFGPWRMRPQNLEYRVLPQAAFHLREESAGQPARTLTLATGNVMEGWPTLAPGSSTYHALFPRGWCEYGNLQCKASLEFFSPIIKENYRETSLPVGVFVFHLSNPSNQPLKISLMFTFPNAPYADKTARGGLSNAALKTKQMTSVVMSADDPANPDETQRSQWCIATTTGASVRTAWDGAGDGRKILADFAKNGQLDDDAETTTQPAGALAVTRTLKPGESVEVPFVLTWAFPQVAFGSGTRWLRRYTEYFPANAPQAAAMATEALAQYPTWRQAILDWQAPYLAGPAPAWLKQGAMNELYYCTFGGSFWENGCITKPKKFGNRPGQHLEFVMECIEYPYAETFDVRQHACRVTRELWPQIERDILLGYADFVKDEKTNPKGAVPHDAGSPLNDPWFAFDQYAHDASARYNGAWPTPWSEYPPKLIQYCYAYWKKTGDTVFLKDVYPALLRAYHWMQTTDTDQDGLSEMLSSEYAHNKFFNAVLWLGALECMKEITGVMKDSPMSAKVVTDFKLARDSTERQFWDSELGYYKFNETNNSLMADGIVGLRIPDTCALTPALDPARLTSHCRQMFRRLVLPLRDLNGDGLGDMGMANCLTPDSKPAVGSAEPSMPHHNEVWVGVSYVAAANLIHYGQAANDGALIAQGLHTAWSTYERTWRDADGDRWFNTPEAWTIDNPNARRTAGPYQRARGIWEVLMEANQLAHPAARVILPMAVTPPSPKFNARLTYKNGTIVDGIQGTTLQLLNDRTDKVGRHQADPDGIPDYHLKVTGVPAGQMPASIIVDAGPELQWQWPADGVHWVVKALPTTDGALELILSTL